MQRQKIKTMRKHRIPNKVWTCLSNEERDQMFMAFLDYEADEYKKMVNNKIRSRRFANEGRD